MESTNLHTKPSSNNTSSTNTEENAQSSNNKREISWPMVLFYIHLNILGIYGVYVVFTNVSFITLVFTFVLGFLGVLGATTGAHRLWAHQTYEATKPLKVFLMICQTLAGQGSIYNWVQSHRLHHEQFQQDDDPFHSNKNFFSAQVMAQITSYTPKQEELLKKIDMSDLEKDGVVMFQKKFYWALYVFLHVLLPVNTPFEYWGDSLAASLFVAFSLRYLIVLNLCWLINSAHFIWGLTKNFKASDSNSVFFITKSYWPQYHYLLPNDYQSGEYGDYADGFFTSMIRVYGALDLAKNLYTISSIAVRKGLTVAIETNRPVTVCIQEAAKEEAEQMPPNHFLNRNAFM
jgi:stearoyl-CoA desaturase (delta-9 desaturase)